MRTRTLADTRRSLTDPLPGAKVSTAPDWPVACVLGGMDIIRPLGVTGIRSWVAAAPGRPPRYSRFVDGVIELVDPWEEPEELLDRLLTFAKSQPTDPVLFYENDGYLALISRFRDQLASHFRFVVPRPELVDDLIDKARFLDLAARSGLPVPASQHLGADSDDFEVQLEFPLILKPLTRDDRDKGWVTVGGPAKALSVESPDDLHRLTPRLRAAGISLLAQSLVPGPETAVESYHAYAETGGKVVADFTGRKIRTLPREFGHSTALTTTDAPDVTELGREVIRRLRLSGVAKLDFKRDAHGKLHLLEVNPRFTLWNHLGALAGVNLPRLVYDDLVGLERDSVPASRPDVTWCDLPKDYEAARSQDIPPTTWIRWMAAADIKTDFAWDDPVPFVRGRLLSRLKKVVRWPGSVGS